MNSQLALAVLQAEADKVMAAKPKRVAIRMLTLPYIKKFYRATLYCKCLDEEITETFEDWVHQGKLVTPIRVVIMDWAYSRFDKSPCEITHFEEII